MDVNRTIKTVVATGEVLFGLAQADRAIKDGKAKIIIRASNCPREDFKGARVYEFPGTNVELGASCGKPFAVSALTVLDTGESDVMSLPTK